MCAQQGRASRLTSTPTSVFPHSQYQFAAQSGSGLVYAASAFYPPASSIPLPISKSSSSSLAAALVPTPEPEPVSAPRPRSESTGCAAEQVKNQKAPAASSMTPNREGAVTHPTVMPNPPARRQFVDESASAAFRAQSQIYQGADVHGHDATQSQSSGHFPYTHSQIPSASTSTSTSTLYPHTHQQLAYVQSDESLWMPDAAFSSYPSTFPLPPTATVAGPSHFSPFPQDFTFNPTGVGPALDIYSAGEGMEEWAFAQGNTNFPAPETYFDFNAASAGAGAWAEPSSLVPQYQIQNGPSTPITMPAIAAIDRRTGNGFASGTGSNSDSDQSADAGAFDGSYFNEQEYSQQQQQHQRNGSTSSGYEMHGLLQGKNQSPTIEQSYGEEIQNSFLHSQSRQSASLSPTSSSQSVHARTYSTQPTPVQATETQIEVEPRQKPQDSSALMPPPPLPARARPLGLVRPQSGSRTSRTALERRHTVTTPSIPNGLALDGNTSPSVATAPSASARSSSAAPEALSSSSLRDGLTHEGPATPKMATMRLNDAMWAQAQERYRCALPEAFRIQHASREPPAEMHIRETSALERSRGNDVALLSSLDAEKFGQVVPAREGEEEAAAQAGAEAEGSNSADASEASTASKDVSDEEFFSRPPGAGWTPARSGYEIGQEAAPLRTRARPGASSSSLVSPVSPASADELVTPHDAYELFPIRQAHMPYAYASPANPAALAAPPSSALMHKVLSVIRHDAHLAPHVSGLGGGFQNAYDGRSYLTDDSELDPEHVPPAPPGARSGDHPALAAFLPHPLAKRGQVWHELMNPAPQPRAPESETDKREGAKDALNGENEDQRTEVDEDEVLKKVEEKGVKKEEKGEGWGFVEGGSHGSNLGLPEEGGPNKHSQRLKLSTDKKTPPKMACHFCRNRKIACGSSKCGDPSLCNQCERRNLRCIFPTISRRGMRTKGQRSAHTVDGTDEADKDSAENDGPLEYTGDYSASPDSTEPTPSGSGSSSLKKSLNTRKARQKGIKIKEAARGRGRGRRKGKVTTAEEGQEDLRGREDEDIEMDDVFREGASEMQVDRTSRYAEDPLASLAAEMQWQHRLSHPSQVSSSTRSGITSSSAFSASSSSMPSSSLSSALEFPSSSSFDVSFPMSVSGDSYSLHMGPSHGPFTTSPLHRKSQQGNAGDVRSSRS